MLSSARVVPLILALTFSLWVACVPSNPTESTPDVGQRAEPKPKKKAPSRPKPPPSTRAMRPPPRPGPVISEPFEDEFERKSIGPDWHLAGTAWKIKNGQLCVREARNKGIWLRRRLPTNARIEFEAVSDSPEGDIKAEFWGDGTTGATKASYTNATSYLTIFGGWKNRFHVLARLDEHAKNRLEIRINPSSAREQEKPVAAGRVYAFRVEREDGKTISWSVDGQLMHRLEDSKPLVGKGHEHFGFNNWAVPVCFDNLKISPL